MILMDLNEHADKDFGRARRRARPRWLASRPRGQLGLGRVTQSFDEAQGSLRARSRMRRRLRAVDLKKIVGSVGRRGDFDRSFMPLGASAQERWKRMDLAFHSGEDVPPVRLYKPGDAYFVEYGNHRVSVARFHGMQTVGSDVTELTPARKGECTIGCAVVPKTRAA